MKFCTPINTNNAVRFAMKLLLSSKESVDMTMDMQGEIDHPLPQRYHHLIARLVKCKITVARYMYGEKMKEFEYIMAAKWTGTSECSLLIKKRACLR